jgi:hypothetical protein
MARVTHIRAFFEAIGEELSRRLQPVAVDAHAGSLRVRTDIGDVTLDIRDGVVRTSDEGERPDHEIEIPQHRLIQLATGFRDLGSPLIEDDVHASPDAVSLLRALFPPQYPHTWKPNGF